MQSSRTGDLITGHPTTLSCEKCNDTRWVEVNIDGGKYLTACACQLERKIKSALPAAFHEARLTDFSKATTDAVEKYFRTPPNRTPGLLLQGPAGTGKTYLAAAITRSLIETGRSVTFRDMVDIYAEIRRCFSESISDLSVTDFYKSTPTLVVDDLGTGALTDFERRVALEIINARMNQLLPTVVTTNLSLDEIRDKMDERIASRLSAFTLLAFAGEDRRVKRSTDDQRNGG